MVNLDYEILFKKMDRLRHNTEQASRSESAEQKGKLKKQEKIRDR